MKKNSTKLIFYFSIFALLLAVGVLVLFFRVIAHKNEHASAVLVTLDSKIKNKQDSETLKNKIEELDKVHETLGSYFIDATRIDSFIEYLEKLGSDVGVGIKVNDFENSLDENNVLLVELSATGKFTDVMRIIKLIENAPYQTKITKDFLTKSS